MSDAPQLNLFPTAVHLCRVDPDRNMRRFYALDLQPDLFGGCTLVHEWGRIGLAGRVSAMPIRPRLRTHSQNKTVAASAIADRKTVGLLS